MSLREQINNDMKTAMKARETDRLAALRLLLAAMKQKEVDERVELTDALVLSIVEKQVKQRRDSVSQYTAAGREDLAQKEQFEIAVLSAYLPQQLSADEILSAVTTAMNELQVKGASDMGKLMGRLKPQLAGKADMSEVSRIVKAQLATLA